MTTDPTITIAGLRAQVETLQAANRDSIKVWSEVTADLDDRAAQLDGLTAERDALAAQLAEVRAELSSDATKRDGRISAICRALDIDDDRDVVDAIDEMRSRHANDLASERAHLAACRIRIAGLEQAANERSAEVARLTARVAELEARPVLTVEMLDDAMSAVGYGAAVLPGIPTQLIGKLGPVTLPAQDRAGELAIRYSDECCGTRSPADPWAMERALTSLGAPPTSPPAVANRLATEAAALLRKIARIGALAQGGEQSPNAAECIDVARRLEQEQIMRPTSPPAARPVFAGVSVEEIADVYETAYRAYEHANGSPMYIHCRAAGIRAVLARLEVSLVAPVDPEAVALRLRDHAREIGLHPQREPADYLDSLAALVRVIFTAAGIPVAPEVRK